MGGDVEVRKRVLVIAGRGQWAYRVPALGSNFVIADTIYNPHSAHFRGMLSEFWKGEAPGRAWLLESGFYPPAHEPKIYVEDEDYGLPRLERR